MKSSFPARPTQARQVSLQVSVERRCQLRNLGGNIGRTHDVITAGQRHSNAAGLRYRVRYSANLTVSTAVYAFLCSPRDFFSILQSVGSYAFECFL